MQQSQGIADRMNALYERWSNGDGSFVDDLLTKGNDCILVGTDPDEWWEGRDNVLKIWSTQIDEMGGINVSAGRLSAFEQGDMGWMIDSPTLTMPDGTVASMRLSAVFARENGDWRIVHAHASVGVPNEEAIGQELTTSPD